MIPVDCAGAPRPAPRDTVATARGSVKRALSGHCWKALHKIKAYDDPNEVESYFQAPVQEVIYYRS
jgi:hypothetical protein